MTTNEIRIDALLPAEMARRAEYVGVRKSQAQTTELIALSILAGVFIAFGAIFATTVATGTAAAWPYGVARLLVGLVFCLGLVLVIVGGAELFTGNNLIAMAWASGKVSTRALLRNWVIVYIGNFIGSIGAALLMFASKQYTFGGGGVGVSALSIAAGKAQLDFLQALVLGILCNALVCLAVWLTFSARSTLDKIAAILFPITAFVAAGFEHSVANMYFVPMGLFIKQFDPLFTAAAGVDVAGLTWGAFLFNNLLPVTLGNIIGGTLLVAGFYWTVYLRRPE
ncbi:MAG: formate/nitrite transporter family protein [Caldilineales bacterium]|nr:formate/nitrite transporter family protein [Caldilineales bacterium]